MYLYRMSKISNIFAHPAHTFKAYTLNLKYLTASKKAVIVIGHFVKESCLFLFQGKFGYQIGSLITERCKLVIVHGWDFAKIGVKNGPILHMDEWMDKPIH